MNTPNHQKGISTLIAAVLLIAVTLLISLIVSTSFTSLVKTQASTLQTRTGEAVNCTSSSIDIESIFVDFTKGTTRTAQVVVRNSGQVRENIISAHIINKTGGTGNSMTAFPLGVAKGDIVTFEFNLNNTAASGGVNITCTNFDRVIITTECTVVAYSRTPTYC